jgi:hypothetical protein
MLHLFWTEACSMASIWPFKRANSEGSFPSGLRSEPLAGDGEF